MNNFNLTKALVFGVFIWIIMFAFISFLIGVNLYDTSTLMKVIVVLVAAILSYLFARNIKSPTLSQAFGYGFIWAFIGIGLDMLINSEFNFNLLSSWEYWLSYTLIIFAPVIRATMSKGEKIEVKSSTISQAH
ncbi:MAG: hypothetical protein KGI58_02460 [Patescibacteria group bacterium]|nr:hypothetical protein [Patescibacteria group bacterium]